MEFTISEVAERTGLSVHTLRYYEKEGLLTSIRRNESGIRRFSERDFDRISLIHCLKETGMPLKKIKQFVDWASEGPVTYDERLDLFQEHKDVVLKQIENLEKNLEKIDYKIWFYGEAKKHGANFADQEAKKNVLAQEYLNK